MNVRFATNRLTLLLTATVFFIILSGCNSEKDGTDSDGQKKDSLAREDSAVAVESVDPATLQGKGETVPIALRLSKGDVFGYSIVTVEDVKSTRDSATEHNHQRIQFDYKFEVLEELPDGNARLKATCLRVNFKGKYTSGKNTREMTFDSDAKNDRDDEKTYVQYNAPVNTPFEFIVNAEGRITETRKVDAVIKRLLMDDYATTKLEARNMILEDYSEASLKNVIQLAFQNLKNGPMKVDSSWQLIWSGQIGFMQVRHVATYTLQGYEATSASKIAHIAAKLQSEYLGKKTFDTGQGMATVEDFRIGGRGASSFDVGTGKPLTRRMKQKLYVRFYIEPPEELKKMAPDQAKNFWLTQDAIIENVVSPLRF